MEERGDRGFHLPVCKRAGERECEREKWKEEKRKRQQGEKKEEEEGKKKRGGGDVTK